MKHIARFTIIFILLVGLKATDSNWHTVPVANAAVDCGAINIVCVSGSLTGNETWTSTNIYVIQSDLVINTGVTLTIDPNVVVKFEAPRNCCTDRVDLIVNGTLLVNGTAGNEVVFTSLYDDDVAGDTNNNGASSGGKGDWSSIRLKPGSTATLNHTQIKYAGYNNIGAIDVDQGVLVVNNVEVQFASRAAIRASAEDDISVNGFSSTDTPLGGLEIRNGTLGKDKTWDQTDIVYIVNGDLTVNTGVTLTIDPNVVVKFVAPRNCCTDRVDLIVNGTLLVNGTAGNEVVFTSLYDDDVAGDTNNNGASSGGKGDWSSIRLKPGSTATLNHTQIKYAGYNNIGAIDVDQGVLVVNNVEVQFASRAAIRASAEDDISVNGFSSTDTPLGGLEIRNGTLGEDKTWDQTDIVYIVNGDLTVNTGVTLTIDPNVVVKFEAPRNCCTDRVDLIVNGTLLVNGTAGNEVVFTSLYDDDVAGDTNNNGASSGGKGDWSSIRLKPGGTATLNHAQIKYAGYNSIGAIDVDQGVLVVNNVEVQFASRAAIRASAEDDISVNGFTAIDTFGGLEFSDSTLTKDTIWDQTDIIYIINSDFTVNTGVTLTIDAGVVVKFEAPRNCCTDRVDLIVNGTLLVNGTAGNEVIFTSLYDDDVAGDTNNNKASSGGKGDWSSIRLKPGGTATLNYAQIKYAGYNSIGAIDVDQGVLVANNVDVQSASWSAISASTKDDISVNGFTATDTSLGGLEFRNTALTGDATWDQTDIVHIISNDFTVANGSKLTINPGIVVKLSLGKSILVDGELDVNGTANNKVHFTSIRDDTVPATNGDTNGDSGNTAPAAGNWKSIHFRNGSAGSIEYAEIRYGGSGSNTGAVQVASVSPSISNSTLRNNQIALYSSNGANPEVKKSDFFTIASLLPWRAALAKF